MLDDIKTYKKYDKQQITSCNERLPEQVTLAWEEASLIKAPAAYKNVSQIVFVGMGGSALGAQLIENVFCKELKVPLEIIRGYTLPHYVNRNSLVILSSFSGSTEEVLYAAQEAAKRGAKLFVITAGGKLAAFAKRKKIPAYIFEPGELAKQPRLGLGFSMIGVLAFLNRVGLVRVSTADIRRMRQAMDDVIDSCALDIPTKDNPAKIVAENLQNRAVIIVAAEHLVGNAHTLSNQINETGKQFATYLELPELNHHFLEGLTTPKSFFSRFSVLMLRSKLYHPRIQKRFDITSRIFERQGGEVVDYQANGKDQLEECGEILQFGGYVSCYLAMLSKVDPYSLPWVDELKRFMAGK